jgi:hypothetical protein
VTAADQILNTAVREVIAALRLGRRIDRHVPTATIAKALQHAADEAEPLMPVESQHLGAVVERRWVS